MHLVATKNLWILRGRRTPGFGIAAAAVASLLSVFSSVNIASFYPKGHAISTLVSALDVIPYSPPRWTEGQFELAKLPQYRYKLANLPTPLYEITASTVCVDTETDAALFQKLNIRLMIKRDDATGGVELGGNKLRKLEFLLADATTKRSDAVVTIGGEQSNHCRATAAATRMVMSRATGKEPANAFHRLEPHLILRTSRSDEDLGVTGNLLVNRMVGAQIYTCTPGEYGRLGSNCLVDRVCQYLQNQGKRPYAIPVGGSNGIGTWGYIEAVDEFKRQIDTDGTHVDHIFVACGSGGTVAGLALGIHLAWSNDSSRTKAPPSLHAVGVCDSPEYFQKMIQGISTQMGYKGDATNIPVHFIQGKGNGYAVSRPEELVAISELALQTGVVLDPVYTGKAWTHLLYEIRENPDKYRNSTIVFWHTGGTLGLYDKVKEIVATSDGSWESRSPCRRLDIYGKNKSYCLPSVDISSLSAE